MFSESNNNAGKLTMIGLYLAGNKPSAFANSETNQTALAQGGASPNYTDVTDGQRHHWLARFSSSQGKVEVFVDGEFEATASYPPTGGFVLNKATVGVTKRSNGALAFQAGNVDIQSVAVYDEWLSDDRIQAHAAATFRDTEALAPQGPVEIEAAGGVTHRRVGLAIGVGL
jgi:hypothetical protein